MKSILKLVSLESLCVLLTSPPASGKTRLIFEILESSEMKVLFISPLRAIVEELKPKLHSYECREINQGNLSDTRIILATAETYQKNWEKIESDLNLLVVLDEYHLFYQWESFRPLLKKCRRQILRFYSKVLLLSATFSNQNLTMLSKESSYHFAYRFHLNLGNYQVLNYPEIALLTYNLWFQFKNVFLLIILMKLKFSLEKYPTLVFVQNRKTVKYLSRLCEILGIRCLSCVGGEAKKFTSRLGIVQPQIIIATSVLSHGVNLPKLKRVFLWSSIESLSLFIQMITRGGRQGENYQIIVSGTSFMKKELKYKKSIMLGLSRVLWN